MTTETPAPPQIDLDVIEALADDLLRGLTPHAGDHEAIRTTLTHWLDTLDAWPMALVCMKALQVTFRDCLTPVPADQAPPGALILTPPTEGNPA